MTTSLSTFDQLQLRGVWVVDTDTNAVLYSTRFGTHIERQHHIGASLANIPDGSIISAVLNDTGLKMADLTATSMGDYRGLLGLREQRQKEDYKRLKAGGEDAPVHHATDDAFLESLLDRVAASSDVEGGVSFFDACAERIRAVNAGVTQYPIGNSPSSPANPSTTDPSPTASNAPPMPPSSSSSNNNNINSAIPDFQPDMLRAGQHLYSRAFMSPNVCEIVTVERPLDKQANDAATISATIKAELGAADGLVDDEGDATTKARIHRGDLVDIGPFVVLSGKRATSISATVEEVYNATGMRPRTRVDPELFTMTLEDDDDDDIGDVNNGGDDDLLSRNVSFAGFASEIASRAKASSARGGHADGSPRRDPHRRHQAATKKLLTKFENHPIHDPLENIIIIVAPLIRGPTSLGTPPTSASDATTPTADVVPPPAPVAPMSSITVSQDNATISSIRQFMGPTILRCFYFTRRWLLPFVDDTLLLRVTLPPPKHPNNKNNLPSSHSRSNMMGNQQALPSASIDPSRDNLDDQMDPDATDLITEATNVASSTLCGYQLTCARRVVTVVAWSRAMSTFLGEVLQRGMTKPILQAAAFYSIGFGSHSSNNPSPAERAHALHHLSSFSTPSSSMNTTNALIGVVGNVCGYKKVGASSSSPASVTDDGSPLSLAKSTSESELVPPHQTRSTPTSASSPNSMSRRTLVNRGKPMSGATNNNEGSTMRSLETLKQLASQPTVMALAYPLSSGGGGSAPVSLSSAGSKTTAPPHSSPKAHSSSPTSYRSGGGFSAMATSAAAAAAQAAVAPIRSEAVAQVIASLAPSTLYRSFEQAALEMGNEPYALPSRSATTSNNKGGGVDVSRSQRVLPEATSFAIMSLSNQIRTSSPAVTRTSSSTNDIEASVATAAKRQLHIYTEELVAGSFYGREENNHLRLTTRILAEPPAHGFSPMHIKALADIKALGGGRGLPSVRRRTAADAFIALASGTSNINNNDQNASSSAHSSRSPSTSIQSPVGDHHQTGGGASPGAPLKPLPAGLEDVEDVMVCLLGGVGPNQQKDLISPYTWSCEALLGAGGAGSGSASSLMPADAATHANPNIGDTVLFTDPGVVSAALNSLLSHPLPTPLNAALVSTTDGVKDLSGVAGGGSTKKSYVGQGIKSMVAAIALAKYVSSGDWTHPATQPNLPDPIELLHLPARYAILTSQTSYPPLAMLACDKLFDVLHARSMQASTALAAGVDYDDDEGNAAPGSSLPRSLFARQQGVYSAYSGTDSNHHGVSGDTAAERYDASAARRSILPTKSTLIKGGSGKGDGGSTSVDVREASTAMLEPLTIAAYKRDINLQAAKTPLRNGTVSHGFKGSYSLVPVLDAGQLRALLASTDFSEGMCPQSRGEVRKHNKDEARANHDWVENLLDVQGHVCYQLELELTLDIGTVPTADIGKLEVVLQMLDAVSVLCYQCTSTMRPPSANNNADGGSSNSTTNNGGPLQFGSPLVSSSITQLSGGDRLLWSIGGGLLDVKNGTSFFLRGLVISDVSARPAAAKLPTFAARNNSNAGGHIGDDHEGDDGYDDYRGAYFEEDPHGQHPGRRIANSATKNVTEEEIIAAVTVYSAASVHFTLLVERPFLPGSILAVHPFIVAKHLLDTRAAVGNTTTTNSSTSPTSTTPTMGGKRYEDTIPKDVDDIHQALRSLSFAGSGVSTANAMISSIYRVGLPSRPHIKYRESEAVWASSNCTQPHPISAAVVVRSDPEAGFTLWNYGGGGGSR